MMHAGFFGNGGTHYSSWLCGPGAFFPGVLGWVITLLFWGLIIYLALRLFQSLAGGTCNHRPSSLETLKDRYARGEINEEQYQRMKSELG